MNIETVGVTDRPRLSIEIECVAQHAPWQSIFLHLLPGALFSLTFAMLSPWLREQHLPPLWAFLIPLLLVLIPCEAGILLYLSYQRNGRFSLDGIVLNRTPLQKKDIPLVLILFVWSSSIFVLGGNLDGVMFDRLFNWLPDWFMMDQYVLTETSQGIRLGTFIMFLLLNGVAGPIVEELYFRGFLLPHIEYMKGWAPVVNIVLFSLYHFFSPWQNLTRILAFLPMALAVRWKKKIHLSMLAHCLLNLGFCLMSAPLFFSVG